MESKKLKHVVFEESNKKQLAIVKEFFGSLNDSEAIRAAVAYTARNVNGGKND